MEKNSGKSTLLSAVVGAAVGAGAVLLADKKSRDSLKKKLTEWMEDAEDMKEKGKKKVMTEIKKTKAQLGKMKNDDE